MSRASRANSFLLAAILLMAFAIKTPFFGLPLLGHFSSYQITNGMMAATMSWTHPASFLLPALLMIKGGRAALHLLYYPFASLSAFVLDSIFGGGLDFWGRLQAAFWTFLSGILLYQITRHFFERKTALMAAFIFSFSPLVMISGISFQNEAIAVFFLLASFRLLLAHSLSTAFFAGILLSLAAVARIHFLVTGLGAVALLASRPRFFRNAVAFAIGSFLPLAAWYGFVYTIDHSMSERIYTSLFTQLDENRVLLLPMIFSGAYLERLWEIFTGLLFTPLLFPFLILSLVWSRSFSHIFSFWFWGCLSLIVLLPQKIMDHPFYLLCAVPAASVLIAATLERIFKDLRRPLVYFMAVIYIFSCLRYFIPPALSPLPQAEQMKLLAARVQNAVPESTYVIAASGPTPDLLYYSRRYGWNMDVSKIGVEYVIHEKHARKVTRGYGDPIRWLEQRRAEGAGYLVLTDPETFSQKRKFSEYVRNQFELVDESRDYLIFDLKGIRL